MVASVMVYSMGEVIGDGLIKLPVVGAVRDAFPRARITWCAAKGSTVYAGALAPVVKDCIDEILTTGPTGAGALDWLTARRPFGGRRFDVVIDTQDNLRRSLVARRAAERLFVSAAGGGRLSHRPVGELPVPVVERLTALVSLAAGWPIKPRPLRVLDERAVEAAAALLPEGPSYVGFAPMAGGVSRRWPLDRFIDLALRQTAKGRTPVFFLGPSDFVPMLAVRSALPYALIPEHERTDAYQDVAGPLLVIALAGRLRAAVANDAGPGHMLAAGGVPLVSLQLDRRKSLKFKPAAERMERLIAEDFIDREPNLLTAERRPDPGMAAIPVSAVEARLERLLEAPS
jgi:ADP-heptose:LPS heptosyltransferase